MYNYDDDSFVERIDIEQVASHIDWFQGLLVEVIGDDAPNVGYNDVGDYDIEVWVEGGRFESIRFESDVDELIDLVKRVYADFDWEV